MQTTQYPPAETPAAPMMPIIRLATLDDAPALAALLQAVGWWPALNEAEPADLVKRVAARLALDLQDNSHSLYVAVPQTKAPTPAPIGSGDALLGYVAIHWLPYLFLPGSEGYISELFVHPQARGQGVGALLLESAESDARRRGCSRLSLLNNRTRQSYERNFYEKHGWAERPVMANFIRPLI